MAIESSLAAIARFGAFCAGEPLVLAASLGGSFAAGRARENSDVDVYVISTEGDYPELWTRRLDFVLPMGEPEQVTDRTGLLDGITFPLLGWASLAE